MMKVIPVFWKYVKNKGNAVVHLVHLVHLLDFAGVTSCLTTFCIENSLHNIFWTVDAIYLIKPILKRSDKVLLRKVKIATLQRLLWF